MATGATQPFNPGSTVTLVGNGTNSVGGALASSNGSTLRVVNVNTVVAFVKWGSGTQTATTADYPVAPSSETLIDIGISTFIDHVAIYLQAAGTANVYITRGTGSAR